jgi:hypothetical protein
MKPLWAMPLRDTLMHIGLADLCQPRRTEHIQEEWARNLLANRPDLTRERIESVHRNMNTALPDAVVTGYEHLIEDLTLPDPGDRHVLAAAIHAGRR